MARVALLGSLLAACTLPVVDAPIPPGYEALVQGARQSLKGNMDGILRPELAFVELRCLANGAHLVLFREVGGSRAGQIDWAMQGPDAAPGGWGGGFGDASGMQEEIDFNFPGVPVIGCPPR